MLRLGLSRTLGPQMRHVACRCVACGAPAEPDRMACSACRGVLGFTYDGDVDGPDPGWTGMWRWWPRLPVDGPSGLVTLGEGGTPLLRSRSDLPVELWLKDETRNPTGSHKDRALAVAITAARARGVRRSAVVSAGSTGLSHAAYCACAGIESVVVMGSDSDPGRAALIAALGARPVRVSAPIDDAIERLQEWGNAALSTSPPPPAAATRNRPKAARPSPTRSSSNWAGRPTSCWCRPAAAAPSVQCTGALSTNGGLARRPAATAGGGRAGTLERPAAGPRDRSRRVRVGSCGHPPATLLGKLCHACPPDGADALRALRESGGAVVAVSDEEAIVAQREFAATEGLYLEVSSAVVLPAIRRLLAEGALAAGQTVVALACGSGFRELPFAPPPAAPASW